MSKVVIKKTVLEKANKTTKQYWRKYTDEQKLHVYYATYEGLLAGNKPLRELAETGAKGTQIVRDYSKQLINNVRGQGYPNFETYNQFNVQEVYDWTDPANPDSVAIVTTQQGTDTGFGKIKAITSIAHKKASVEMSRKYPNDWKGFEIDVGHVLRSDQPSLSPGIARAENIEGILEERTFTLGDTLYFYQTKTAKAKVLKTIRDKKLDVYDVHDQHSVKYTREFDPTGIVRGNLRLVITVQHDRKTNQRELNKIETGLGGVLRATMSGLNIARLAGSPSIAEIITKAISNSLKGIVERKKYVTEAKRKRSKVPGKQKVKLTNVDKNIKLAPIRLKKAKVDVGVNLLSLQNLINSVLSIRVREQMDEASDPPINLRYQTGRFANSAVLLTLTRTQAGILAGTYTYQRNPYDVFLSNPRRDPRIYVEGAIRETALALLKKRFPGIVLNLQ